MGVKNKEIVIAIAGELLRLESEVKLKKVEGHSGNVGNNGADALANEGALQGKEEALQLDAGLAVQKAGTGISALTQAVTYKLIRDIKRPPMRRRTRVLVDTAIAAVEGVMGSCHSPEALWKSLRQCRSATLSQKFSAWAWKTLHMGYKVGTYWAHIVPERVACTKCIGEPAEDIAHILLSCRVSH